MEEQISRKMTFLDLIKVACAIICIFSVCTVANSFFDLNRTQKGFPIGSKTSNNMPQTTWSASSKAGGVDKNERFEHAAAANGNLNLNRLHDKNKKKIKTKLNSSLLSAGKYDNGKRTAVKPKQSYSNSISLPEAPTPNREKAYDILISSKEKRINTMQTTPTSSAITAFLTNTAQKKKRRVVFGNTSLGNFLKSIRDSPPEVGAIKLMGKTSQIRRNLPAFMIIGVQKASTTLLGMYLQQHPSIMMMPGENHVFDQYYPRERYQKRNTVQDFIKDQQSEEFDARCMQGGDRKNGFLCGMKDPRAILNSDRSIPILKVFPWPIRFLVMLRDPVDRAESQLRMEKKRGLLKRSKFGTFDDIVRKDLEHMREVGLVRDWGHKTVKFDDFIGSDEETEAWAQYLQKYVTKIGTGARIGFVARGLYDLQLRSWMKHFQRRHIMVLKHTDLMNTENAPDMTNLTVNKVFEFLNVSPHNIIASTERMSNTRMNNNISKLLKSKPRNSRNRALAEEDRLSDGMRNKLREFYAPYNQRLEKLLGDGWKGVWEYDVAATH